MIRKKLRKSAAHHAGWVWDVNRPEPVAREVNGYYLNFGIMSLREVKVGTARCAVRVAERSVRRHGITDDLPRSFRLSRTGTSQRGIPTSPNFTSTT